MPKIIKNGRTYGGGGGSSSSGGDNSVVLTQAEYDALPSSKLTDNINYFVTDGQASPEYNTISASGISYDNTDSGLTATNVQDAIDELNGESSTFTLSNINTDYYNGFYGIKSGKFVFLKISVKNIPSSTWTTIGINPYPPTSEIMTVGGNSSITNFGVIKFSTDGTISCYHTVSSASNFYNVHATYLIN